MPTLSPWFLLVIAIAAEVVGTAALKASDGFTRPFYSALAIGGYGAALYFLSFALREIPVGVAYAIWSGVGVAAISLIGAVAFGQRLDAAAVLGVGLIVAGVVVLNTMSNAAPR